MGLGLLLSTPVYAYVLFQIPRARTTGSAWFEDGDLFLMTIRFLVVGLVEAALVTAVLTKQWTPRQVLKTTRPWIGRLLTMNLLRALFFIVLYSPFVYLSRQMEDPRPLSSGHVAVVAATNFMFWMSLPVLASEQLELLAILKRGVRLAWRCKWPLALNSLVHAVFLENLHALLFLGLRGTLANNPELIRWIHEFAYLLANNLALSAVAVLYIWASTTDHAKQTSPIAPPLDTPT